MPWFYYIAKVIVSILIFLCTRQTVKGRENIPRQGPVLVVANHLSLADPPLLGYSLNRKLAYMAKEELFRSRFFSYFLRSFGAFPVRRRQPNKEALRQAKQALADGLALVMFPEGRRSRSTELQPALSGSALVAYHSNAPLLPVGITGTERIKGLAWIMRRPQITVNIGPPFFLPRVDGKLTKDELIRLTNYIMERIAEILPPEYRGSYAKQKSTEDDN